MYVLQNAGKYSASVSSGGFVWMLILILGIGGAGGYASYKYRIQVSFFLNLNVLFLIK
jgi:hypothetical protein